MVIVDGSLWHHLDQDGASDASSWMKRSPVRCFPQTTEAHIVNLQCLYLEYAIYEGGYQDNWYDHLPSRATENSPAPVLTVKIGSYGCTSSWIQAYCLKHQILNRPKVLESDTLPVDPSGMCVNVAVMIFSSFTEQSRCTRMLITTCPVCFVDGGSFHLTSSCTYFQQPAFFSVRRRDPCVLDEPPTDLRSALNSRSGTGNLVELTRNFVDCFYIQRCFNQLNWIYTGPASPISPLCATHFYTHAEFRFSRIFLSDWLTFIIFICIFRAHPTRSCTNGPCRVSASLCTSYLYLSRLWSSFLVYKHPLAFRQVLPCRNIVDDFALSVFFH